MAESQLYEPHDSDLRAGDQDREAVADILREQHLAGRLDSEEFQERIDRCYAAKTYGELRGLVADLPEQRPARSGRRVGWRLPVVALLPLLLIVVAAGAVSHGHLLWLAIPLFFFVGRPLLWRRFGWGVAGCGPRRGTYV
jgi:hypothetical protein